MSTSSGHSTCIANVMQVCYNTAGVSSTKSGELTLLCPACPQPRINLSPDWTKECEKKPWVSHARCCRTVISILCQTSFSEDFIPTSVFKTLMLRTPRTLLGPGGASSCLPPSTNLGCLGKFPSLMQVFLNSQRFIIVLFCSFVAPAFYLQQFSCCWPCKFEE